VFQDLFNAPPDYHTLLGYLKSRARSSNAVGGLETGQGGL
jgi:hypothetical protein